MAENQGRFGPHLGIESLALWWRRLGAGQKPGYCEQMLFSEPDAPLWSSEETLQNCYRSLTKVRTWPPSTAPARRAPDLGVSQPCSVTRTCLPAFWGLLGGLPRARRLCTLLLALTFLSPNTSTPSTIVGTYRGPRALGTRGGARRGCPEGDGGLLADAGEARATTLPCGGRRVRAASPPQHVLDTGSSLVCVEARPHEGQWRACLKMLNLSTPVGLTGVTHTGQRVDVRPGGTGSVSDGRARLPQEGQTATPLGPRCSGHLGREPRPGRVARVSPTLGGGRWCSPGEFSGAF